MWLEAKAHYGWQHGRGQDDVRDHSECFNATELQVTPREAQLRPIVYQRIRRKFVLKRYLKWLKNH